MNTDKRLSHECSRIDTYGNASGLIGVHWCLFVAERHFICAHLWRKEWSGKMSAPAPSMYSPAAIETARQLGLKMGKANLEVFAETLLNLIAVGSYQRTMLSGLAVLALAGSVRVFADNAR